MSYLDKNLIKSAALIGIGSVTAQALALCFMLVLARIYSRSDYGLISYTISIGTLASTFVAAGFPASLVRFLSKYNDDQEKIDIYFSNILTVTLGILVLVSAASAVIYRFDVGIISIIIGYSIVYIYLGVIRGFINYWKITLFNVLGNLFKIIVLVIASYVFLIKSPLFVVLLYAFGGVFALAILEMRNRTCLHYCRKYVSKDTLKEISAFSIPVMISMLAFNALSSIPIMAIKSNQGYDLVALYSVAMTFTVIFSFIPTAITTITMPKISRIVDKQRRIEYTAQSVRIVLVAGIVLYVLIFLFGRSVLEIAFTEKYVESYPILLVLSIGAVLASLRNVFCSLWEGSGHPIIATYDIVSASLVCILLSLVLVPQMGPIGAAYGYSSGLLIAVFVDLIFWIKYKNLNMLSFEEDI